VKTSVARRISLLEQHRGNCPRRIHVVTATDEPDRDRQMAKLVKAGIVGTRAGFLCLIGNRWCIDARA
jgi:hypothetical protein